VPARPPAVYLHVGPPKTGTTFLQDVLWRNRETLSTRGLTVPGGKLADHFHAALDLRGIAFGGYDNPAVPGAWDRITARARGAAVKAVITHEVLAGADVAQVGRAVSDLAPCEVHVVYAVRDLARQLPAVWQEGLKNRRTRTFDRFLDTTLDPEAPLDRGFWRSQQPLEVLGRWAHHVPADRIYVVTLPPAGGLADGDLLWTRFCTALGIDGSGLDLDVARTNASLTVVQSELLRRLNQAIRDEVDWPAYERLVKSRFNELADAGGSGRRPRIPTHHRQVVQDRAEEIITALRSSEFHVIGDLDDLRPSEASFGRSAKAPPDKVAGAAVSLLAELLVSSDPREGPGDKARSLLGKLQGRP
jgi:hypothetical protein